ncbi:MAG: exo-alpha-sialidase [Acidobacteria bacterium]|nr:exo-alpha-sialidase [Acidobacteriota bacterium]
MAADMTLSPFRGNIYISWTTFALDSGSSRIRFSRSTNSGASFTAPIDLQSQTSNASGSVPTVGPNGEDWFTVDPVTGEVYVSFYDWRDDPDNYLMNVYMTRSTDGGQTFEPNIKLTTVSLDPANDPIFGGQPFVGDYTYGAAYDRVFYPVWTDYRKRSADIWGAIVNFKSP